MTGARGRRRPEYNAAFDAAVAARYEDEDEVEELWEMGGAVHRLPVGLYRAMARARAAFLDGSIDVDEFEHEVERLLRKGATA